MAAGRVSLTRRATLPAASAAGLTTFVQGFALTFASSQLRLGQRLRWTLDVLLIPENRLVILPPVWNFHGSAACGPKAVFGCRVSDNKTKLTVGGIEAT